MVDQTTLNQQIKAYLETNPSLADIASAMQTYNVTPAQMAQAVGLPVEEVQTRYKEAAPSVYTAENVNKLADQILSQGTTEKWTGGLPPEKAALYMADELAKSGVTDITQVAKTDQGIINSMTGDKLISGYGERTGGNLWSGSYEGSGNTGFGVNFDDKGNPIFFTQGASSSTLTDDLLKVAALAAAVYGGYTMMGGDFLGATGADAAAAAAGADTAAATSMGGAGGITGGYSGLGINAGTNAAGALSAGPGFVAGAGLGEGVLLDSTLGQSLLGSNTLAGLTGTGILAGSDLGVGLLGTTSTTPLVGTGILTGSDLGASLLGTGANTAATVGGLTGLANVANVGAGALDTGVTLANTGLGTDAINTGVNTVVPPGGTPVTSVTPNTTVTPPVTPGTGTTTGTGTTASFPWTSLASSLYDMYAKNQMADKWQAQMDKVNQGIEGLYAPGSAEYQALWNDMSRKDAAAGRGSQYGVRAVDLAGKIAPIKTNAMVQSLQPMNTMMQNQMQNQYGGLNSLFYNMANTPTVNNAINTGVSSLVNKGIDSLSNWISGG